MPSFRNIPLNVNDMKTILNKTEPSSILLSSGVGCGDYQIRVEKSPTNAYGRANRNTLKFLVINRYLFKTAIRHRVSPEFIGLLRTCVPMAFTAESPPAQGQ